MGQTQSKITGHSKEQKKKVTDNKELKEPIEAGPEVSHILKLPDKNFK